MSASIVIEASTARQLVRSRRIYQENEPRDVAYRVAIELLRLVEEQATEVTEAQVLAVLLQSWNMAYYRAHPFTARHFTGLERLLRSHAGTIATYRHRSIEDLDERDRDIVKRLFGAFEALLGRVGAAKALHLLAPRFFPLWDNPSQRKGASGW